MLPASLSSSLPPAIPPSLPHFFLQGHLLSAGDLVLGYDVASCNPTGDAFNELQKNSGALPDVVLVRKRYRKGGRREWKLQSLQTTTQDTNRYE